MKKIIWSVILLTVLLLVGCQGQIKTQDNTAGQIATPDNFQIIKSVMANESPLIVDIRTPEEFNDGHIEGAINVNFYEHTFFENMKELPQDRPIIIYCRSGHRSALAIQGLKGQMKAKIYEIEGGILGWQEKGGTVTAHAYY